MKIFTHNFDPRSNSGPNKFSRTLFNKLIKDNKVTISNQEEADVEFCLIQQQVHKVKPMVLRLDGIWFNSEQDFKSQNAPIQFAYKNADAVIFQSRFNKSLTEAWFGKHDNSFVIPNASDSKLISKANKYFWDRKFGGSQVEVWSCASSWRPHKRLKDNINFFLEFAPKNAILAVAGKGSDSEKLDYSKNKRVEFLGELDYMSLLSLYKRSTTFIHLAYLDHCPNVVVDAQASGCKIICSSTGGTHEIVSNGLILVEDSWDMKPCQLYKPPIMDYSKTKSISRVNKNTFSECVQCYFDVMKGVL